jgi:hypothetical protein
MIFPPQFKKIKSIRFLENLKNVKNQYKKFSLRFNPDCRVGQFSTRSWVRNQAAPEVRVRKTTQKYSGAPAQVLHEKVERAERVEGHLPHLIHMRIYQHLYVLVCSHVINNT